MDGNKTNGSEIKKTYKKNNDKKYLKSLLFMFKRRRQKDIFTN